MEKRRCRSWPLYLRLRKDRWRNVITSDEAWVYLTDKGRKRSVQYISRDKERSDAEPAIHVANPRGVMVWVAMSANGLSRPLFVEPGAKINAEYYQEKILKPLFEEIFRSCTPTASICFIRTQLHRTRRKQRWSGSKITKLRLLNRSNGCRRHQTHPHAISFFGDIWRPN